MTPRPGNDRLYERITLAGLLLLSAWVLVFAGAYLFIAYQTLGYPFDLEWMEGGTLDVVTRIRDGEPIYQSPSLEYVAYIYTPFYYIATAVSSYVLGVDLLCARMVSFVATLGTAASIHFLVRHETKSHAWGFVGAGLFLASYDASGKWFHLARVDNLALFGLFASFAVLRMATGWRSAVAAGLVAWFGVFTKQTMLVPFAFALVAAFFVSRKRTAIAGATFGALSLGTFLGFELTSDAWFSYYTFWLPTFHPLDPAWARHFFRVDLALFWPVAVVVAAWVVFTIRRDWRKVLVYCALVFGCLEIAYQARSHVGGFRNVLMPAHAALILTAVVAAPELLERAKRQARPWTLGAPVAITALLALQLAMLEYDVDACIPLPGSEELGSAFLAELDAMDGDVLLPDYPWHPALAGKHPYGLGMAARDVLRARSTRNRGGPPLSKSLEQAFTQRRFEAVILSKRTDFPGFRDNYRRSHRIESPAPVTGSPYHPSEVWVPKLPDLGALPQGSTQGTR